MADTSETLLKTPLHALHVELGAKMVPFAGYDMPVQYPAGVLKEHLHTREKAGLFDVSHMGQRFLVGPDHETVARALESVTPGDFQNLGVNRMRYTTLLAQDGGIIDDLMASRLPFPNKGALGIVFNAGRKEVDDAYLRARLPANVNLHLADDFALLALQGPLAEDVVARHCPDAAAMSFMTVANSTFDGIGIGISRSGYTGEDGYEISMHAKDAERVARALLGESEVLPIGLGARDSLRLEAGLCLYGHDIDETVTPVEANLVWSIAKRRKMDKDFPAAEKIMDQVFHGVAKKRVGILPVGKAPAREHTPVADKTGRIIGEITSGGFGPSVNGPVAMGYVETAFSADGTEVDLIVRGKPMPARIAPMPFFPHRYRRAV